MSLQSRLSDLITAIGADVKALQNRVGDQYNASVAQQTGFSTDTYLTGSAVAIPQGKIKAGTIYRCKFDVVKTNAGTAAPVLAVRVGTAASILDGQRSTVTFNAQTGAVDEGVFEVECVFRQAGATAVIQTLARLMHRLATTGLSTQSVHSQRLNTSAAFDVTGSNLKIGLSVNGGLLAAWTINVVSAELINLTP